MNNSYDDKLSQSIRRKRSLIWWILIVSFIIISVGITLIVIFAKPSYPVLLSSNINIEINGSGTYKEGSEITISAIDVEGYRFNSWTYNGEIVSQNKTYTFIINEQSSGTYNAIYDKLYYISIGNLINGDIFVDKVEAIKGEEVRLTIIPDEDYFLSELYYVNDGDDKYNNIENNNV